MMLEVCVSVLFLMALCLACYEKLSKKELNVDKRLIFNSLRMICMAVNILMQNIIFFGAVFSTKFIDVLNNIIILFIWTIWLLIEIAIQRSLVKEKMKDK